MIHRVADEVDQGVTELVDHPLVQLGLLTLDPQGDFLAGGVAEVPDDAVKAVEEGTDGDHPGFQHAALDAVADPSEVVDRLAHRPEVLTPLLDQVEFLADRPEVLAKATELR